MKTPPRIPIPACLLSPVSLAKSDPQRDEDTGGHDQQQQESEEENRGKRAKAYCQNFVVVATGHFV